MSKTEKPKYPGKRTTTNGNLLVSSVEALAAEAEVESDVPLAFSGRGEDRFELAPLHRSPHAVPLEGPGFADAGAALRRQQDGQDREQDSCSRFHILFYVETGLTDSGNGKGE